MQSDAAPEPGAPGHRRFETVAREMVLRGGALATLRTLRRGARILGYHRFPAASAETLRAQCEYLRKFYDCVSLDVIVTSLKLGRAVASNIVAVTVDDGYRDFYQVAYPVFRAYGIPVTVFLTTGFLDAECWLWCDIVAFLFRHSPLAEAEIPVGSEVLRFHLHSAGARSDAAGALKERLKRADDDERRSLLKNLPALLRCPLPEAPPPAFEPLRWDEVRLMSRNGVSFGAHTRTHPILSTVSSAPRLREELEAPKARISNEIGVDVRHFAYPNGTLLDVNQHVVRNVEDAGYEAAVIAEPGPTPSSANRYLLCRNMTEPGVPVPFFGRNMLRS